MSGKRSLEWGKRKRLLFASLLVVKGSIEVLQMHTSLVGVSGRVNRRSDCLLIQSILGWIKRNYIFLVTDCISFFYFFPLQNAVLLYCIREPMWLPGSRKCTTYDNLRLAYYVSVLLNSLFKCQDLPQSHRSLTF